MKRLFNIMLLFAVVGAALCEAADEPYFVERYASTPFDESITIPADFGRLVAVTRAEAGHYLWLEATDGTIRLVIMEKGGRIQKGVLVMKR